MKKLYGLALAAILSSGCAETANCSLVGGEVQTVGADALKLECQKNRELTFKCIIQDGDDTQIVELACGALLPEDFLHFAEADIVCNGSINANTVTASCGENIAPPGLPR